MNYLRTGLVTQVNTDGVWCEIPSLAPRHEFGPFEIGPFQLESGDRVLLGQVSDTIEEMVVLMPLLLSYTPSLDGPLNAHYVLYYENFAARAADVNLSLESGQATWLDDEQRLDIYTDEGTPGWIEFHGYKDGKILFPQAAKIGIGSTGPLAAIDYAAPTSTTRFLGSGASGDSAGRYILRADGLMEWGSGAGGRDTNLYRSTNDTLKTDDSFIVGAALTVNGGGTVVGSVTVNTNLRIDGYTSIGVVTDSFSKLKILNTANASRGITVVSTAAAQSDSHLQLESAAGNGNAPAIGALLTGDTQSRFGVMMNGTHVWGPGNAPQDTNLYRVGPDQLKTDDSFTVGLELDVSGAARFISTVQINGAMQLGATAALSVQSADTAVTSGQTTSTSFTNSLTTTGIRGVAFVAPPSGKVEVCVQTGGSNSTAAQYTLVDFEVRTGSTPGSGTVIRASDENSASQLQSATAGNNAQHHSSGFVTGLTPGTTYNASMTYRVTANTGSFNRRKITVKPLVA